MLITYVKSRQKEIYENMKQPIEAENHKIVTLADRINTIYQTIQNVD